MAVTPNRICHEHEYTMNTIRIGDLRNVIAWSLENGGLTAGQRILIHQEIASLLARNEAIETEEVALVNINRIPVYLEEKVIHILSRIRNTKWQKTEFKY